ncbi:MAG: T9SS type A sorting domain-containing protein [Lachnoclostridium sp.]|nr:T9SS type A sorting domain-containing protein [Lachnoclostridium sp.]
MKRLLTIFMLAVTLFVTDAAAPKWEEVNAPSAEVTFEINDSEQTHITVKDNYIYISSSHPASIKIFTILGQLISQETVPAGTHRFKMNARGIYILKVGSITRRVTI